MGTFISGYLVLKQGIYYGKSILLFNLIYVLILVDTGHKAFKFNKFSGVMENTYKEGYHLKFPWLEKQVIYNVKS